MNPLWSYALAALGLAGLWLAGSGRRLGWLFGVAAQILWIAYAIATQQWGFIVTAVAYAVVYLRGARKAAKQQGSLCANCGAKAVSWIYTRSWNGHDGVTIPSCGTHISHGDYAAYLLSPDHGDRLVQIINHGLETHTS